MTSAFVRTCARLRRGALLPALALLAGAGCSSPFGGSDIEVTVSLSETRVIPSGTPVIVTVTAHNTGNRRIVWGQGSSSCQLDAVVRVGGRDFGIGIRGCTADLVEQGLDGGAERTEAWQWDGTFFGDSTGALAPGTYEIRGRAGDEARSAPVAITVAAVS